MISIYQGNDKTFVFFRMNTDGDIITTKPQSVLFTVKLKYSNVGFVIRKTLDNGITQNADGSWSIKINAEDTQTLEVKDTKLVLVCDVKIIDEDGNNVTIVKPQDFVVLPVVTN